MDISRYELKRRVVDLRRKGLSYNEIQEKTGVPKSTLSGWLQGIRLTETQRDRLHNAWLSSLVKAREKAVIWHNAQKQARLSQAREEAKKTISAIVLDDKSTLELALALLYLGEGAKKSEITSLGSSDPMILRFFIRALEKVFNIKKGKLRCYLHLRYDQNPSKEKAYWSSTLGLSEQVFQGANLDKRTKGSATYEDYHGVCAVQLNNVAIKRRLLYLSELYCERISEGSMRA